MPRYSRKKEGLAGFVCCKDPVYLCCSSLWCSVILVCFAVALGLLFGPARSLLSDRLDKKVALTPTSGVIDRWLEDHFENSTLYFFNVTNPKEVQETGAKPALEEVGPFVYTKRIQRFDYWWSKDENLMQYSENISYTFNPKLSKYDPRKHNITSLNIPLIVFCNLLESPAINNSANAKLLRALGFVYSKDPQQMLEGILQDEDLFVTMSIQDYAWGYPDPVFLKIRDRLSIFSIAGDVVPTNFSLLKEERMYPLNQVLTGKNDTKMKGEYVRWNGLYSIDEWDTPTARMINGTDGTLFRAQLTNSDTVIYMFSEMAQRSFFFFYQNDSIVDDIPAFHYVIPAIELQNGSMDPGFFPNGPSGVFNLSAVEQFNAPLFVSKPHFLDADEGYIQNVTGLKANRSEHDFFVDVEPNTGETVHAAKRIQYNVQLKRYNVTGLQNLSDVVMFPILYLSEVEVMTEDQSEHLKKILVRYDDITTIFLGILLAMCGVGLLVTITCFVVTFPRAYRKMSHQIDISHVQPGETDVLIPKSNSTNSVDVKT